MTRPYVRIPILIILVLALLGVMALGWYARERSIGIYTDEHSIRRDAATANPRDVLWTEPELLAERINSDAEEYEVKLSGNGTTLYFVRGKAGENADLYTCALQDDGTWSEPEPLTALNTDADELGPEPSRDGNALYFSSNRGGGLGGYDLWVSRRVDGTWQEPENLGERINSSFNDYSPALLKDGTGLYFASNRPQPTDAIQPDPEAWHGTIREDRYTRDFDIYFAASSDHGLGDAGPLEALNSSAHDGAPAVSPVGDFVYFASDREGGEGGFDLYRARRHADGSHSVESLGPAINSPWNELDPALSMGGFALHFSSNRLTISRGDEDADHYDLFLSTSREVYLDFETRSAEIDLTSLLTWLLWLLLALLALLLLLGLWKSLRSDRFKRLSLLARCLLASMLVHLLLLLLLTLWGVGSSFSDWMKDSGSGTRVAITSPNVGQSLAQQVRGALTAIELTPETSESTQQEHESSVPIQPTPLMAMGMQRVEFDSVEPIERVENTEDASLTRPVELPEYQADINDASADEVDLASMEETTPRAVAENSAEATPEEQAEARREEADALTASESTEQVNLEVASSPSTADEATIAEDAVVADAPAAAMMAQTDTTVATPDATLPPVADTAIPVAPARAAEREADTADTVRAEVSDTPRLSPTAVAQGEPDDARVVEIEPSRELNTASAPTSIATNLDAEDAAQPSGGITTSRDAELPEIDAAAMTQTDAQLPEQTRAAASESVQPEIEPNQATASSARSATETTQENDAAELVTMEVSAATNQSVESSLADATPEDATTEASMVSLNELETNVEVALPENDATDIDVSALPNQMARSESESEASELIDGPRDVEDTQRSELVMDTTDTEAALESVQVDTEATSTITASESTSLVNLDEQMADASFAVTTELDSSALLTDVTLPELDADATLALPDAIASNEESTQAESATEAVALELSEQSPQRAEAIDTTSLTDAADPERTELTLVDASGTVEDSVSLSESMLDASDATPTDTDMVPIDDAMPELAIVEVPIDLGIPNEVAPPNDAYRNRDPEVRSEILREMGGDEETETAVDLALQWLARQQADNGRWDSDSFDEQECPDCNATVNVDTAITGLSLLCFLAANHTHMNDGPYQETVRDGVDWLLTRQAANGSLLGRESMYSHGIATIALAEAYGMTKDERLREPVQNAVDFIIRSRNRTVGGWRYAPGQVGDTSVLGWQVMAMKSAERAGLDVDPVGFEEADRWLSRVHSERRPGRYAYQPNRAPTHAMTAEAIFVRQLIGVDPRTPQMRAGIEYVMRNTPDWDERPNTYYWYYATLAIMQHQGDEWDQWNEIIKDVLVDNQVKEGDQAGSWATKDRWSMTGGRIYQTAICTLTLEVYYRYLPMYLQDSIADADDEPNDNRGTR